MLGLVIGGSLTGGYLIGHIIRLISVKWRNYVTSAPRSNSTVQVVVKQQEEHNCVVHAVANAIAFNKSEYVTREVTFIDNTDVFERCASVLGRCHGYRLVSSYRELIPDYCVVSMDNGIMYKREFGIPLAQQFAELRRNPTRCITFLCRYNFIGPFGNIHCHIIAIMLVKSTWGGIHKVIMDSNNVDIASMDAHMPVHSTCLDQIAEFQDEMVLTSYCKGIFSLLEYIDTLQTSNGIV